MPSFRSVQEHVPKIKPKSYEHKSQSVHLVLRFAILRVRLMKWCKKAILNTYWVVVIVISRQVLHCSVFIRRQPLTMNDTCAIKLQLRSDWDFISSNIIISVYIAVVYLHHFEFCVQPLECSSVSQNWNWLQTIRRRISLAHLRTC